MTYYKVLEKFDNCYLAGGGFLVGNELYTEKELKSLAIPTYTVEKVRLKKSMVYWCFGCRFEMC